MDVARLNMSHGSHADHAETYRLVREAADELGHGVGIVADLQGPKIRLETFAEGSARLEVGAEWTITTRDVAGRRPDLRDDVQGPARRRLGGRPAPDRRRHGSACGCSRSARPTCAARSSWAARSATTRASTCPAWPCRCRRCRRRTSRTCASRCASSVDFVALSFVRNAADAEDVRADHARGGRPASRSSPRSRSRRRSTTSTRSSPPSTASWSPAATWAWSAPSRTCRSCRSGSSSRPASTPSRSSSPPRCSSR